MNRDEIIQKIVELEAVKKEMSARNLAKDLFEFNKQVLQVETGNNNVPLNEFHREVCEFVMNPNTKKKLLLLPRGHLKSTLVTVGYSLLRIAQDPTVRILIANATYDMSTSFLGQIKKHLKENDKFKDLYGDYSANPDKWAENMITIGKKKSYTKKEATVTAFGMGGNLVSQHYDVIIMDDLVNRDYVNTAEQIEKTILFYKDSLDLLEPNGVLIVIGTRWADSDLYGWIMDKSNPEQAWKNFDVMVRQAYQGNLDTGEGLELLYPQKFTADILKVLKQEKGPYEFSCTPKETPILMSDWTQKPIGEIVAGDEVVGWKRGNGKKHSTLVRSKVIRTFTKVDDIYELTTASGRIARCTKDHRWYTGRLDKTHKEYAVPKIGRKLQFICPTELPKPDQREWDYLAGMFDGEGSSTSGGCLTITQGMGKNLPVCNKIKQSLSAVGIEYGEYIKNLDEENVSQLWLRDNFMNHLKFIRYTDLAKKYQLIENLYRRSSRFVKEEDPISEMKFLRRDTVYALETETGNYIAWGFGSSNSQYMNDPVPQESAKFKLDWMRRILEDELKTREMNYFTTIDPAIGQLKSSDKTAIVTIGVDQWNNWFVVNIIWGHYLPNDIINLTFANWERFQPRKIGIELTAYQKSLQYAFIDEMRRRNIYLPIVELKADRSKQERIEGLIPRYANGSIYHLQQCPYREQLEDELIRFPRGKHDDIADALAYGNQICHPSRANKPKFREREDRREKYLY